MNQRIETPASERRWHIDRNIPLALVYLTIGQFFVGMWFIFTLYTNDANQDSRLYELEQMRSAERLMLLESQMQDNKQMLMLVNANVLRILERKATP